MPNEEHDGWLSTFIGKKVDDLRSVAKSAENLAGKAVQEVKDAAGKAVDLGSGVLDGGAAKLQGAVRAAENLGSAAKAQVTDTANKVIKAFTPGASPGPMGSDCKPVRGQVPGPAEHVLCGTHGHILDVKAGQIIAASLDEYKRNFKGGKPTSIIDDAKNAGAGILKTIEDAASAAAKSVAGLASGASFGPMAPDCKPVRGKVPGPAEHVLCQTHGHVLDVKTGQVIARSLEDYKANFKGGKPASIVDDVQKAAKGAAQSIARGAAEIFKAGGEDAEETGSMFELTGGGIGVMPDPADNPGRHVVPHHDAGTRISFAVVNVGDAGGNARVGVELDDRFVSEWQSPYLDPGQQAVGYVSLGRLSAGMHTALIYVNPGSGQADHSSNTFRVE